MIWGASPTDSDTTLHRVPDANGVLSESFGGEFCGADNGLLRTVVTAQSSQTRTPIFHSDLKSTLTNSSILENSLGGDTVNGALPGTLWSNTNDGIQEVQQTIYTAGRPNRRCREKPGILEYNGLPLDDVLDGRDGCMSHLNIVAFPDIPMPSKISIVYQVSL